MLSLLFSALYNRKWTKFDVQTSVDGQSSARTLPQFSYPVGPTSRTKQATTPLEVFMLFVTVVVLESIVRQTLLFANVKGVAFSEFYLEELQAFIALNVAMGMLKLPEIKDYWCTNVILSTPWFSSIMRFYVVFILWTHRSKRKPVNQVLMHSTKYVLSLTISLPYFPSIISPIVKFLLMK